MFDTSVTECGPGQAHEGTQIKRTLYADVWFGKTRHAEVLMAEPPAVISTLAPPALTGDGRRLAFQNTALLH